MLGALVGEILAEQRGPAFLAAVEALRRASILRRETQAPVDEIASELAGIELAQAADLVRAFATYFRRSTWPRQVHRIRRRRDHERSGDGVQPGGLRDAIAKLAAEGVAAAEIAALLPRLRVEPVFTAHPTRRCGACCWRRSGRSFGCLVGDIDAPYPGRAPRHASAFAWR